MPLDAVLCSLLCHLLAFHHDFHARVSLCRNVVGGMERLRHLQGTAISLLVGRADSTRSKTSQVEMEGCCPLRGGSCRGRGGVLGALLLFVL
jgi:hypothetical protein